VGRIDNRDVRVITPVYFLATKLEAFRGRDRNDYRGSHDLEDVVAIVDALPGFLLPDSASQARRPLVLQRLTRLARSEG